MNIEQMYVGQLVKLRVAEFHPPLTWLVSDIRPVSRVLKPSVTIARRSTVSDRTIFVECHPDDVEGASMDDLTERSDGNMAQSD